jgi:hypothetical protein
MKIHGIVFIIIGAVVLVVSLFKEELLFFRYVGGLFLIYGTFKLVFKLITDSDSKKEALQKMYSEQLPRYRQGQANTQPQGQQGSNYQRLPMFKCKRCGYDLFPHNNFCANCGTRLR